MFNPAENLRKLQDQSLEANMLTTFVIPEGLPEKVKADKNWLEYVVTGLIKNAHDRTRGGYGVTVPVSVNFQFVTGLNNWKTKIEEDASDASEYDMGDN